MTSFLPESLCNNYILLGFSIVGRGYCVNYIFVQTIYKRLQTMSVQKVTDNIQCGEESSLGIPADPSLVK